MTGSSDPIVVGVVNNMGDSSVEATERQFRDLLSAASPEADVRLRFFRLPDLPRGETAGAYVRSRYEDVHALWSDPPDGLIVTGTEPRARALADEPYWDTLTRLVDWAADHTTSAIWSCLAAHAAVDHLDGVERHRFESKISGVFDVAKSGSHEIVAGLPDRWPMPHSRFNTVAESSLLAAGYEVLAASASVGPDLFVRRGASLFVFLQGHPEYDAGALGREYWRDVRRFLMSRSDRYPDVPRNYFSAGAAAALAAFRCRAERERTVALLAHYPIAVPDAPAAIGGDAPPRHWRDAAERLYANWLGYLATHRPGRMGRQPPGQSPAMAS